MPFLDVRTSCPVSSEQETLLKAELGKAIALIPGKSESSLMVQFTDNCRLWMGGKQDGPIAFVNVMIYGTAAQEACERFQAAVIPLLERELGAKHVYLKFEEVSHWFWN